MRFLAILLLLASCGQVIAAPLDLRGLTMGTTYHIKLATAPSAVDGEQLHAQIDAALAEVDQQMSTYRSDSELSRFNRSPGGPWFPVSPAVAQVVAAAQEISEKTEGALDVTVGPLVRLWHFGPRDNAKPEAADEFEPPTEELLRSARELIGYPKLEVRQQPPALRKTVAALEVDLSSIASGYAIDQLAAIIERAGVDDYMISLGGEIRAAGLRPDGSPWRVAIERPIVGRREKHSSLPLRDAAIATAGDYQKFFEHEGKRYSHIIDPASGRPVEHRLASVTVVADTCIEADGWDTPLLVLGPERGYECAERNGIAALFISRDENGETEQATTAWQKAFTP